MPKPNITDGVRTDTAGNVWRSCGWGDPNDDGVRCYNSAGDLLGKVHIPETVANLCFGGTLSPSGQWRQDRDASLAGLALSPGSRCLKAALHQGFMAPVALVWAAYSELEPQM